MQILRTIRKTISNLPGWRTNRKIIVIESDDWGSIRMPSKEVYQKCLNAGYPVDKNPFERYDSLLSQKDIELLFETLTRFKDKIGNCPVITANCVVANPDFEKIRKDNFNNYHYELITDTFKKYPQHSNNFELWQQGIKNKIFFPQYHAREHLNVSLFMEALRNGDPDALFGFENHMPGSISREHKFKGNIFVEATNYCSTKDKEQKLAIFLDGLDIFEKLFGYISETIIPPNYIWSPDYNEPVFLKGVKFFQGIRKIREPIPGKIHKNHYFHFGKKNSLGQIYLTRNVLFEPSLFKSGISDPTDRCLSDICMAFKLHKPAVITSHRLNYVGFIDQNNRDKTLKMLHQILNIALKRWSNIEFMTSFQLGNLINSEETIIQE